MSKVFAVSTPSQGIDIGSYLLSLPASRLKVIRKAVKVLRQVGIPYDVAINIVVDADYARTYSR